MKHFWKKTASACIAAAFAIGCMPAAPVSAEEVAWPSDPSVVAETAILMDADSGAVLYSRNPDQQMYPASITKIMTTLLALENSSLDDTVVFSYDAVYKNESDSSHIARDVDEEMTMEETLYAVMLESANECAYAVAEHVGGGDYQTFIDMMNERAAELGCTNTHFNNANGLPDEEHVTTARDMALIAREAIKDPEFREIIGTTMYVIPPTNKHDEETYLNNHNKMINDYKGAEHLYEYCIGGKTGYTEAAGNTFVTYAEKDGQLLIAVVMRSEAMYDDCENMFEYGFNNFQTLNVAEYETRYGDTAGEGDAIFDPGNAYVELDPDAEVTLPDGASFNDTTVEITYDDASDDILGTLTYYYDDRQVGTADIIITGSNGADYTFGETIGEEETALVESGEALADEEGLVAEESSSKLPMRIWILIVIAAVLLVFLIVLGIAAWRRNRRRRRRRKKANQYKKIKQNKKW